ncbi:hypothetical protein A2765_05150 [Candidatus Kaiserbacteria bacterium RIFCSPHIGHO2_01_FULL_56_24]|uniref:Uncharacterized protein n=1 Tax=Candidatus Kaiserbacteria bacterium RIFCSPHIGHO2_01_FULL_56_24 TaxID=1798487 RepID=A0A1F6D8X7_9BACT|nr:MAG: hypothetical protein A2765_05150 [Candidatus Kaiserbacteria bacterium RIFCSPHIGHO2_01_FULL_56_24]
MHIRLPSFAFGILIGAVIFGGVSIVLAWTGPTSAPPSGNVSAPLNVGTADQIKNGVLGVNALAVFGNAILSGAGNYLNFGTIPDQQPPSTGYGIRDNAGVMEFKDSTGLWLRFLPSTSVQSIQFADGTTQTTAAVAGGATQQTTISCSVGSSTGTPSCTTANCPAGYVRSGCSAADTSSGAARADIMSMVPSGTAACTCRFRALQGSFGGIPNGTCYTYCVK